MANCEICHKPVVLIPSAQERAAKHGGAARDYIRLFDTHASCFIEKRKQDTLALIRRIVKQQQDRSVTIRTGLTHKEAYGY